MGRAVAVLIALVLGAAVVEPNIRKCGRSLGELVKMICNADYAAPSSKRTIDLDADGGSLWTSVEYGDADPLTDLVLSRAQALSLAPGLQRVRRSGLADECCRKTCSIAEISAYCRTAV